MLRGDPKLRRRLHRDYFLLHRRRSFAGITCDRYRELLTERLKDAKLILDYGCGPRGGLARFWPERVFSYDPYVWDYRHTPWEQPFDAFVAIDVFEHLLLEDVLILLRYPSGRRTPWVFIAVATRPAEKSLPSGLNAHLLIEPAAWWRGVLQAALHDTHDLIEERIDLDTESACWFFQVRPEMAPRR